MSKIISVNKKCYPVQDINSDWPIWIWDSVKEISTVTVLVEGEVGDYAAYTGHGDPTFVASFGDKISFLEACCHFGKLEREKYRN